MVPGFPGFCGHELAVLGFRVNFVGVDWVIGGFRFGSFWFCFDLDTGLDACALTFLWDDIVQFWFCLIYFVVLPEVVGGLLCFRFSAFRFRFHGLNLRFVALGLTVQVFDLVCCNVLSLGVFNLRLCL